MEEIFQEQQKLVNYFFNHLDHAEMTDFANKLLNCQGIVFLTGMGKSGIIAKNISQMLVSTGIRAMFLDPVNALHGDVGVVGSSDLVLLFSKSGQSSELVDLLPALRNKNACLIAVVSNRESVLARECHHLVFLPLERELCPFGMAPTTSTIIQLAFGNTIVAYLMKCSGLTQEAYAMNHPAGRIGKRLTVRVADIMTPLNRLPICALDDRLVDCLSKMSSKRCGCLLICNSNGYLEGIFTDGDLRRAIEKNECSEIMLKSMNELMIQNVSYTKPEMMAFEAMKEMERCDEGDKKRVKELPVVNENGKLLGLIMLHDLVEFGL